MKIRITILAAASLLASACASTQMAPQAASFDSIQQINMPDMPAMGLGAFGLAPGLPAGLDKSITIRASTLKAPGGTFSGYLRQTLETQLTSAGKLNPSSDVSITAELTKSEVKTSLPNGTATIAAHFHVAKAGTPVFDRELSASDEWPSSFIGAIAIPQGMDRYTALYPKLVTTLLSDAEFRKAVKAQ